MNTMTNAEIAAAIEVATRSMRGAAETEVQHHMFKHHLTELLRIQRERAAAKVDSNPLFPGASGTSPQRVVP
jgi:hypothetical protein